MNANPSALIRSPFRFKPTLTLGIEDDISTTSSDSDDSENSRIFAYTDPSWVTDEQEIEDQQRRYKKQEIKLNRPRNHRRSSADMARDYLHIDLREASTSKTDYSFSENSFNELSPKSPCSDLAR